MIVVPRVLTPGEVARLFNVSVKTLHSWEKVGRIKSFRTPGNHRRYRAEQFEELIPDLIIQSK